MLVLQKAANMVCSLREVAIVACASMFIMLLWMALWSFGAAGVVASSMGDGGRWWLLVVSWQVLLFIFFPYVVFTTFAMITPELMIFLLLSYLHTGLLCKLVLDWCSPL